MQNVSLTYTKQTNKQTHTNRHTEKQTYKQTYRVTLFHNMDVLYSSIKQINK